MTQTNVHDLFSDATLQQQHNLLQQNGYVNFVDLPDDFPHLDFVQRFGALVPQYDGQFVWSVKAEPGFENVYHSLNTKPLLPHTECYEFESRPPRYIALWCVTAPSCEGGQTILADSYAFLSSLKQAEREPLFSLVCKFSSTPGLQQSNLGSVAYHPICERSEKTEKIIFRYSFSCLDDGGNQFIADIRQRVLDFFEKTSVAISYKKNSLVIWDNWRLLHARTGFKDSSRHLKRVWLSSPE